MGRCRTCLNFRTKTFLLSLAEPARMRTADVAEMAEMAATHGPAWATLRLLVPVPSFRGTRPRLVRGASEESEPPVASAGPGALLLALLPPMTVTAIKDSDSFWQALPKGIWVEVNTIWEMSDMFELSNEDLLAVSGGTTAGRASANANGGRGGNGGNGGNSTARLGNISAMGAFPTITANTATSGAGGAGAAGGIGGAGGTGGVATGGGAATSDPD